MREYKEPKLTAVNSLTEDFQQRCLEIQIDENGLWTLKITDESWKDALIYARELEKQQIVQAWNQRAVAIDGEAYYKHTFGAKT
jgi:hypothetical protein